MTLKLGDKVKVTHHEFPFTGVIERVMKWENPLAIFDKKGTDYAVRADDDNKLYKVESNIIEKI